MDVAEGKRPTDSCRGTRQHVDKMSRQGTDKRDLNLMEGLGPGLGLASSWLKRRCVGTSTDWEEKTLETSHVLSGATRSMSRCCC